MADIDLKTATPDTSLPTTGFLFGADSQASASPSVYSTQTVATTLLGSTSLTGATITTSQPVLDLAQTWNASGVTFTGLKFNATDTASAAGSLLMDLQTGGTSRASFRKNGDLIFLGSTAIGMGANNGTLMLGNVSNPGVAVTGNTSMQMAATAQFGFAAGNPSALAAPDTVLTRRAAANLRLGAADAAAPVAQTLSVQSVVAGTTNTAGANLTITGSQGTGTGAGGSIVFQVAPAGSTGTAQNALATALTISPSGTVVIGSGYFIRGFSADTGLAWTGNSPYLFNGSTQIGVSSSLIWFNGTTSSFPALKRSSTTLQARLADDSAFATIQGKLRADVNAVAETPTATHTITITDAAGTAYKVLCVAA